MIFSLVLLGLRLQNLCKGTNASVVSVGGFPFNIWLDGEHSFKFFPHLKSVHLDSLISQVLCFFVFCGGSFEWQFVAWSKWFEMGWNGVKCGGSHSHPHCIGCRSLELRQLSPVFLQAERWGEMGWDGRSWVAITWPIIPAWCIYLTFILRIAEMWGLICHALHYTSTIFYSNVS